MIGWAVAKGAWAIFKASPIARTLAKIGGMILLVGAGLWKYASLIKRSERAKRDLADAKETIEAYEVRNEVENRIARERDARERLRSDWRE